MTLGYNFRMSNITAALGIAQLSKVDKIIQMRRENAEKMSARLSGFDRIRTPHTPEDYFHVYQMYSIQIEDGVKIRDDLSGYLNSQGIMTKVYFKPVHQTEFFGNRLGYQDLKLPVTERVAEQVLTLPMYPSLTAGEIDYISDEIGTFLSG